MSADADVAIGFMDRWNATPALSNSVPGGLHQKPLKRLAEDQNPLATPYAEFEVGPDQKKNETTTGLDYIDYRRVKLTLHGVEKKKTADVVSTVIQSFRSTSDDVKALTIPNIVAHMRTEFVSDNVKDDPTGPIGGQDVQEALLELVVWSHRTNP